MKVKTTEWSKLPDGQEPDFHADYPIPLLSLARTEKTGRHVVLGYDIPKPRPTLAGLGLCILYLGVPVAIIGNLIDFVLQLTLGWCIGVWCLFKS